MKKFSLLTSCAMLAMICILPAIAQAQARDTAFTDSRNGKKYKAIRIGKQIWMAQNLNYATSNSWCYDNQETNCNIYGRLYTWSDAKIACPAGWRLPADKDYNILTDSLGGEKKAGGRLKTTDSTYWKKPNTGASNTIGYSALPGGYHKVDGTFGNLGYYGTWWTFSQDGGDNGYDRYIHHVGAAFTRGLTAKTFGFSVRCIKE